MELYQVKKKSGKVFNIAVQRKGNDRNGNPVYLLNVFTENCLQNVNYLFPNRDKMDNIRIKSYNIKADMLNLMGTGSVIIK